MAAKESQVNITFFSKTQITCPICSSKFKREELMSGRGRLIAGSLTDELHRLYEPASKYGEIFPLIYNITVCPKCHYAAFPQDFSVLDKDSLGKIDDSMQDRYLSVKELLPSLNFSSNRTLIEGAASYYLALLCYELVESKFSPTIKRGLCALRSAWIFSDLAKKYPEENYDYVSSLFYKKSSFFYKNALNLESSGKEMIAGLKSFGPDIDKNYGFDGVLYIAALLEYKYGTKTNKKLRENNLQKHRRALSKLFGLGKSSKNKPGPLLEHARDLYDSIVAELNFDEDSEEDD